MDRIFRVSRSLYLLLLGGVLAALPLGVCAAPALPPPYDSLVKVTSKKLDAVYLLPGADFTAYRKVMIDPVQVSFRKDWVKEVNRARGLSRRIDDKDALEIATAARSGFDDIFAAAFKAKGYEVVTAAAPDVLRLSPAVANLYINAPDPMTGTRRTYTVDAGEASLALQANDSTTGAVLGVALDRRQARGPGGLTFTTGSSNREAFADLFRFWADTCVKGLEALKASPPAQRPQRAQ